MNKTAIKNFAVWARRKLISEITYKASLIGISEKGILHPLSTSTDNIQFFDIGTGKPTEIVDAEIKQREALIKRIKEKEATTDYKTAFQFIIEEVAYTWFNRLIAIRFMEVNDYLPSGIRVLSSETAGKVEPDMVTAPFDTDMEFSSYETDRILQLKDENKLDELFRMLFIKQCNKLNEVLPALFENTADYTELLLPISFTDSEGIVSHLINDIEEEDFKEAVEIIGWLYQYYNTEPKDEVFALLKKNVKITKERIPAATQLFTPNWIVRYMVENSLGRLWVEGHPNDELKSEWRYYLEEADQEDNVKVELEKIRAEYKMLSPEDIKVIDPCMGSGHILVYAFDVLMQIYETQGYTQRDAAVAIIENNLYGLDIDDRAYQLAYFAIVMKARKYDRRFFTRGLIPNLYAIKESKGISIEHLQSFGHSLKEAEKNKAIEQMTYIIEAFRDAKEYGSIINIEPCDWTLLNQFINDFEREGQLSIEMFESEKAQEQLIKILAIAEIMTTKYDIVVTNPPYMGSNGMSSALSSFVKKYYPSAKSDLSTVFMIKTLQMCKDHGYITMINIPVWMFLSSYGNLRSLLIDKNNFVNMVHFGRGVFGSDFGTTSFVLSKNKIKQYIGTYLRLFDKQGAVDSIEKKEQKFFEERRKFLFKQDDFKKIPGEPIAYWIKQSTINAFSFGSPISSLAIPRTGIMTGNNERFLRLWWEIDYKKANFTAENAEEAIHSNAKWFPYNKGGEFRKWYGNNDYVVNWEKAGYELFDCAKKENRNSQDYPKEYKFLQAISWSLVTSGRPAFRLKKNNLSDIAGPSLYVNGNEFHYVLAFCNSIVALELLNILNPTINYQAGNVGQLPIIHDDRKYVEIISKAQRNIEISKEDWDSSENSWEFEKHPLLIGDNIKSAYNIWSVNCDTRSKTIKENEKEINELFLNIYNMEGELETEVEDLDITLRKADLEIDIKSLISYAVGCMFGRYSLDVPGVAYAGGEWDTSKYSSFMPDADNCIPITDEEYFEDDIVGRFVAFVKTVYGEDTLEENLDFIAQALGNKGSTSREIIRNYFIKDFYKDHVKMYQKRPIYWLYDSGKQNGFKALVYMHRYTADTTGVVRVDYLHKMQKIYMSEIDRMTDMAENSNNGREVAQAEKRKEKLIKQLKETKEYDEKVAHLALSRIATDLDDGVKVNYENVQTGQDGKKLAILGKI